MDDKAKAKGFRYKIVPTNREFEPLYVRKVEQVSVAMNDWPNVAFRVHSLQTPAEELRELGL